MKLIISLLVYNQPEVTKKCIASILENSTSDYQLIISDNDSNKETQNVILKFKNKRIRIVRNRHNLGFITAHNNVFTSTESKYFCVLNNDLIIKTKGWDSILIDLLEENFGLAQIGNKQDFGYLDDTGTGKQRNGKAIDYIQGSCFIVNRDYVNNVGGLFENKYLSFAFCEDSDLSLRLRSRGYKIAEFDGINILHFHNQTFKHEKLTIDYKSIEKRNKEFLVDRWSKYIKTRRFDPMRILVDRQAALGDCLCVEPIIRGLKEKYPNSQIFVNTRCTQPFRDNPYVVECGNGLLGKFTFDLIIDLNLAYEKKPKMHIVDAYAQAAGIILNHDEKVPRYYGIDKSKVTNAKNTIVICSDYTWPNRVWPRDRWIAFIDYLANHDRYNIVEVGKNQEFSTGFGTNLIGILPFETIIGHIASAEMYIGMDSAFIHFAQAVGTPVFSIFGCTNPKYRIHDWSKATVVSLDKTQLDCAYCHHDLPAPRTYTECSKDKIYCLENISLATVIDQFERS